MTTPADLIRHAEAVLLDFDGPMAQLMPPPYNAEAADQVRCAAGVELPPELQTTTDHLAILRHLVDQPDVLATAEVAATAAEVECAKRCDPAPWLDGLLDDLARRRVPWAVVTNNTGDAVRAFTARFDHTPPAVVADRALAGVERLKPDPFLISHTLAALDVRPWSSLFVGDSVTDVTAGQAAGVPVLGYASTAQRAAALSAAGALHVRIAHGDAREGAQPQASPGPSGQISPRQS